MNKKRLSLTKSQNIEYKESWRDEYLKWICGFANAQGGVIFIGVDDDGRVVGVKDAKRLLEDLPNKIAATMGLVCEGLRENDLKMPDYSDFLGGVQFVLYRKDCFVSSEGTKYSLGGEGKTREKIRKKTGSKILNAIREDSFITTSQLADICNLTKKGIEYHLSNLKKQGKLRRVGHDKGGHWEVLV